MFGAILGLVNTAIGAGKAAAQASSARRKAATERLDAEKQYSNTYNQAYDRTRGDVRDAAILQGLARTGGGSAASVASGMSQMGQNAGAIQANANLAAHDAARGYVTGVQNQRATNANMYNSYNARADGKFGDFLGGLSQLPAAAAGMGQWMSENFGNNGQAQSPLMGPQGENQAIVPQHMEQAPQHMEQAPQQPTTYGEANGLNDWMQSKPRGYGGQGYGG